MIASLRPSARAGLAAAAGLLLLLLAGCASDEGPRGARRGPPPRPITPMAGTETFLAGQLVADISVGPLGGSRPAGERAGGNRQAGKGAKEGRGLTGGFNVQGNNNGANVDGGVGYDFGGTSVGGGTGGRGGGMGGGFGGREGGHHGGRGGPPSGERGEGPGPGLMAGGPIASIHLRFTNHGPQPITFRIVDFLSPVGNFVVQPDQLTLAPGQSAETEPMSSLLVSQYSEFDVTLVLRTASQAEKKILAVRALAPAGERPAAPDTPPPPAP